MSSPFATVGAARSSVLTSPPPLVLLCTFRKESNKETVEQRSGETPHNTAKHATVLPTTLARALRALTRDSPLHGFPRVPFFPSDAWLQHRAANQNGCTLCPIFWSFSPSGACGRCALAREMPVTRPPPAAADYRLLGAKGPIGSVWWFASEACRFYNTQLDMCSSSASACFSRTLVQCPEVCRVSLEACRADVVSGGLCSAVAARASTECVPECGGEYLCSARAPAETTSTTERHNLPDRFSNTTELACVALGVARSCGKTPRGGRRAKAAEQVGSGAE